MFHSYVRVLDGGWWLQASVSVFSFSSLVSQLDRATSIWLVAPKFCCFQPQRHLVSMGNPRSKCFSTLASILRHVIAPLQKYIVIYIYIYQNANHSKNDIFVNNKKNINLQISAAGRRCLGCDCKKRPRSMSPA